jgi:D-alanyl-D-alanine carboxypeptidase/D-alanyl-D-alanine-endopeptidase (penicillin-binding protein 4)
MVLRFAFAATVLCGAVLCRADMVPATAGAPAEILKILATQRLPPEAVSFVIMDAATGRIVVSHGAEVPRSPASTLKVVTTFASLDTLGPAFTWQTRALIHGAIENGVLSGDLVLQGGGDPYMTLERWWGFARLLRSRGLKAIRGDIIVDNTGFSVPNVDPGAFDGRPNRAYNVLPDALMVNFQSIDFTLVPNANLRKVEIVADPAPVNLTVDNRIRYADGRCSGAARRVDFDVASAAWDRVVFTGMLSRRCASRSFTRVLLKPPQYAYGTFVSFWRSLGGEFDGRLRVEAAPPGAEALLAYDSLTLGEVIRLTNKYSSNLMARHLLLTMGRERFGAPATIEKGTAAIGEWSRGRNLGLEDVDMDNGSGLSRSTRISVLTMANVLDAAYRSRYAPEFIASLPLAGIDGTLRTRMLGAPAGAVRLKTGHLDGVSGIAGYVTAANGRCYVLVCLVNHPRADDGAAEPVHAALVQWVLDQH